MTWKHDISRCNMKFICTTYHVTPITYESCRIYSAMVCPSRSPKSGPAVEDHELIVFDTYDVPDKQRWLSMCKIFFQRAMPQPLSKALARLRMNGDKDSESEKLLDSRFRWNCGTNKKPDIFPLAVGWREVFGHFGLRLTLLQVVVWCDIRKKGVSNITLKESFQWWY